MLTQEDADKLRAIANPYLNRIYDLAFQVMALKDTSASEAEIRETADRLARDICLAGSQFAIDLGNFTVHGEIQRIDPKGSVPHDE